MTATIRSPFFEIGPKTFLDRGELLKVVEAALAASTRHDVDVIVTPPALDIEAVKHAAPGLFVFAQAMDVAPVGASTGAILPEALAAVGADGVMLNHAERPIPDRILPSAIRRAQEADLLTLVCAEDVQQATRYAGLGPSMILFEPHALIGTAYRGDRPWISDAITTVADVDPNVSVMHSGGVTGEHDVRSIIAHGAAGTGCTTAIVRASDRQDATTRMIRAVREGWDSRSDSAPSSTFIAGTEVL